MWRLGCCLTRSERPKENKTFTSCTSETSCLSRGKPHSGNDETASATNTHSSVGGMTAVIRAVLYGSEVKVLYWFWFQRSKVVSVMIGLLRRCFSGAPRLILREPKARRPFATIWGQGSPSFRNRQYKVREICTLNLQWRSKAPASARCLSYEWRRAEFLPGVFKVCDVCVGSFVGIISR